jgi:hypothetical protein
MGVVLGNTNPSQATVMAWILKVAQAFGVPPALIYARADIESNFQQFDPNTGGVLTSSAGAVGIMQTIPRFVPPAWGLDVAHNWQDNVLAGVKELVGYYAQYHNWHTSFAAYAAGPGNISGGQAAADHEFNVATQTYGWTGNAGNPNPNATFDPSHPGASPGGGNQGGGDPGFTYRNPMRDVQGLTPFRIDQGVDYGGGGPIYAIGRAKILQYIPHSGWVGSGDPTHPVYNGGYIAYQLLDGPAKGKVVFVAEDIRLNPSLKVGSVINTSTALGQLQGLDPGWPYMETGWATSDGSEPLAKTTGGYTEGQRTWAGNDFSNFLHVLGAPAGVAGGRPLVGQAPQGWPGNWGSALSGNGTGGSPGGGGMNVPNGTTPAELASILRGFGINPRAFHDLIDQAIRGQWSGPQFEAALYGSKTFHQMFPGIFRNDGSLKMSPAQWNSFSDMYRQVARGSNIQLDRDRIGNLIHKDVSVDEFRQRMNILVFARNSEQFRANFNHQRQLMGKEAVGKNAWYDIIAGAAPPTLYDEYEAAYLQSGGLHLTPAGAHHVAAGIDERGTVASQVSMSDIVRQVQQMQSIVAPELKANGITTADLALLQAGKDPRGLYPTLQRILQNRAALPGSLPRAQTFGQSRTVALFPAESNSGR